MKPNNCIQSSVEIVGTSFSMTSGFQALTFDGLQNSGVELMASQLHVLNKVKLIDKIHVLA